VIYRFWACYPLRGNGFFIDTGGANWLRAVQLFDLLVQSTISSYGTKYNKYLLRACTRTHAHTRAHTYAPTRTRTHK